MNTDEMKQKVDDVADQATEKFKESKENVEDMYEEGAQRIGSKGGEIKQNIEEWSDDDTRDKAHSSEMDPNPLDQPDDDRE